MFEEKIEDLCLLFFVFLFYCEFHLFDEDKKCAETMLVDFACEELFDGVKICFFVFLCNDTSFWNSDADKYVAFTIMSFACFEKALGYFCTLRR